MRPDAAPSRDQRNGTADSVHTSFTSKRRGSY